MEKKDISDVLENFAHGTELNIGLLPNLKVVKYGYDYINNELKLYLQGVGETADILNKNKVAHFIKWGNNCKNVSGDGKVKILEDEDEKLDGLNKIIKQHNKNNVEYDIVVNDLNELFIFEINVENTYLM